jgi:hypothetical protein
LKYLTSTSVNGTLKENKGVETNKPIHDISANILANSGSSPEKVKNIITVLQSGPSDKSCQVKQTVLMKKMY